MNIRTLPSILFTFPKSGKKLTIFLLSSQPLSGCVQAPSNFFICQFSSSFLWVSDKLVTISNSYISANTHGSHLNKTERLNIIQAFPYSPSLILNGLLNKTTNNDEIYCTRYERLKNKNVHTHRFQSLISLECKHFWKPNLNW